MFISRQISSRLVLENMMKFSFEEVSNKFIINKWTQHLSYTSEVFASIIYNLNFKYKYRFNNLFYFVLRL